MTALTDMGAGRPALRKAEPGVRRHQLIEATIAVLARRGYAALTVADVARQAGLDWEQVGAALKRDGRLHLETY